MGSADAFELAWQMILAPLKLIFIILVGLMTGIIVFSISLNQEKTDLNKLEISEISNILIDCVVEDAIIKEDKITEEYLGSCLSSERYGASLEFKGKKIILNEEIYTSYKDLCNRISACNFIAYKDLNGNILKLNTVFKRIENE